RRKPQTITVEDEVYERDLEEVDRRITLQFLIEAVVWFAVAAFVLYYSEIISVILYSEVPHRIPLYIGLFCAVLNVLIALYHIIYVQFILKVPNWEDYNTPLVYVAIITLFFGFISLCIGLWPVYSFVAPIIIAVLGFQSVYLLSLFTFT
ncbi:hypothetical protein AKO1_011159, partial [Acrasis kona]